MSTAILYNDIASGYNVTRRADPYLTTRLFELLSPQTADLYLDIGCGTGNYTIALAKKGLNFYGVEPAEEMLKIAGRGIDNIKWLLGSAGQIPVASNLFAGAIATLTIHHWANINTCFKEISRVLKPGSRLVIFTALPAQMEGYWLNHYFPKMLQASILQMPPLETIEAAAKEAGFLLTQTEKYVVHDDLQDHFLYTGKNRPQLYLNEKIRRGISSFSALANAAEVAAGLLKLAEDINAGRFAAIKAQFENDNGDYLFITLQKIA